MESLTEDASTTGTHLAVPNTVCWTAEGVLHQGFPEKVKVHSSRGSGRALTSKIL